MKKKPLIKKKDLIVALAGCAKNFSLDCASSKYTDYKTLDGIQSLAYQRGYDKAVDQMITDAKNLPKNVREVLILIKDDPKAFGAAMLQALKEMPAEYQDKAKKVLAAKYIAKTPAEFEAASKAELELKVEIGSFMLGGVGAVKTGAKVGAEIAEKISAKAAEKAPKVLTVCSNGVCFVSGTLIETDQGFKAVENFVGGERVWSRNDRTLEYGYRPVIATKETADQTIFEIVIQNQQGQQEKLETTAEHPFWVKNFGWLKSSLLQSGMILLDRNNEELTVVNQVLIPNKVETVYNIEVDGFHTYHVGELGTWVHNANCCDIKSTNVFVPVKPKLNYAVDIENKGHGLQNIDISTKQRFDEKGIPADTRTTKSFLYSSFDSKSGEFYIQKMEAYQKGNNTGKEMLSQAIEKIGYSKINSAKAELADTNKLAFENAYTKSGNAIEAVNNTPLGKAMNDLGFKVDSIDRNLGSMPKVKFIRK
ncbi:MAG: hypothetical protein GAK29_01055 [Acinetobacter bereziniae]|uniref:Hint domain-containing protein n=1 Tax=Acinetobacter bereziniae TaxID=106648 RepID=A0A833PE40_ACIBZ|nr:MAG: hypothetical protein GAK29_01055 [Acinetobacter bereziniae]